MEKEIRDSSSKKTFAVILIAIGSLWLIGMLNIHLYFGEFFRPVWMIFQGIGKVIFSWPMILVLVGLILISGKRSSGWILVILGGIFLLPRIFIFPHFPTAIILPLALILIGGMMIIRRI
jgi:4-amino-4-deoxy-L-arabinose transferase-like glycosyltransferase